MTLVTLLSEGVDLTRVSLPLVPPLLGAASRTHVEKVYQAGYLEGFTDNTFRPTSEANRAQMAKILYNFLESIEYIN